MSPLLQVDGLTKSFGGLAVSRGIALSLDAGARVALIGPNGAGKTTFVDLVTGLLRPSAGSIALGGRDITRAPAVARVRLGLARTFQASRLFPEMNAREHLGLAILQRERCGGRLFGRIERSAETTHEIDRLLMRLGLADVGRRPAGTIAYGEQRLLELAIALALRPKVLLLDEPAAGVPQGETPRIIAALDSLPADLAVLMIEHDMDLVFRFARRIVVLAEGAVIFDGLPAAAARDRRVREAYLGSYADAGGAA